LGIWTIIPSTPGPEKPSCYPENPDFFGLIFETWCTGRRSKCIKEEFNAGINQRIADIKEVLEDAAKQR
jgi:hypothetical protein